jgi:hypothetical protein
MALRLSVAPTRKTNLSPAKNQSENYSENLLRSGHADQDHGRNYFAHARRQQAARRGKRRGTLLRHYNFAYEHQTIAVQARLHRRRLQAMKLMLKHVLAAVVLLLSFAAPVAAGPFEDAVAARDRGDYALGKGVPQDYVAGYAQAMRLSGPLADHGDAEAQEFLGSLYEEGKGAPQDYPEAAKWYRLAADQGNAMGQAALGSLYVTGRGVPRDFVEAAKWFRRAADQGNVMGQAALGSMYEVGKGVPQDYVAAHMWLNLAAAQHGGSSAREIRDKIASLMTPAQIAKAQKLAREWKPTKQTPVSSLAKDKFPAHIEKFDKCITLDSVRGVFAAKDASWIDLTHVQYAFFSVRLKMISFDLKLLRAVA